MTDIRMTWDFETRSRRKLELCGAIEYAKDISTSIFCLAYKINTGTVKLWIPEKAAMPRDMWHALCGGVVLVAHNASFERAITKWCLPRYDTLTKEQRELLTNLKPSDWRCTAAKAAASSLPRSLEMGAKILGLKTQKDMAGNKLIKKYSRPRKPTKNNPRHWWCDPSDLKRIYAYCKTDVQAEWELDEELPDLSPMEQKVWELDQKINDHGVLIDIPTVKTILAMISEEMKSINARVYQLSNGTIDTAGQRAKILAWVNQHNGKMENLQAGTMRDKLLTEDVPSMARYMLELRQAGSKTSTGKYISMLHAVGTDNRARELLLYHGTIPTARWSGKRIQPHNFPRPTIKGFNSDEAIALIQSGGLEGIRKKYGPENVMDVLVSSVRGMLIASPGKELFCADFAAVEARLAFWVAGHEEGLDAFRNKEKLYEQMAAEAFDMEVEEVEKDSLERFVGKESVLGCFEASTPVLTDEGWKPIVNVLSTDKVWDGIEWINHTGVIFQGLKETIHLAGIGVTPEHQILMQEDCWVSASQVAQENTDYLQLAVNTAHLGLRNMSSGHVVASQPYMYPVLVIEHTFIQWMSTILKAVECRAVKNVVMNAVVNIVKSFGDMRILYPMTTTGLDFSIGYLQQFKDATTQMILPTTTMVVEESKYIGSGVQIEKIFFAILSPLKVGIFHIVKWIGVMSIRAMSQAILDLLHTKKICSTNARLEKCKKPSRVYDVTNAGPRNRFTILTDVGPIIVHNCQYGMGWVKFKSQCHKKGMNKVTDEIAKKAVYTYRRVHHPIPTLWRNLEEAALHAVMSPGEKMPVSKVVFYTHGDWLNIRLPSGRRLRYYKPCIKQKQLVSGRMVPEIRYQGLNMHYWGQLSIWGGIFCNHIVQGIARDLMVNAVMNIDAAGYDFLLSVHDEGLSERAKGKGSVEEYAELMTRLPGWADGAPITAECWKGPRYKK